MPAAVCGEEKFCNKQALTKDKVKLMRSTVENLLIAHILREWGGPYRLQLIVSDTLLQR